MPSEAAIDDMEMSAPGCVPIKLYLQSQGVGGAWPYDCSLLHSAYNTEFLKMMSVGRGESSERVCCNMAAAVCEAACVELPVSPRKAKRLVEVSSKGQRQASHRQRHCKHTSQESARQGLFSFP